MALRKNCAFAQFSDTTLAFFTEIVSLSGLFVDNFPSPSDLESLLGSTVCFHFWHRFSQLRLISRFRGRKPWPKNHVANRNLFLGRDRNRKTRIYIKFLYKARRRLRWRLCRTVFALAIYIGQFRNKTWSAKRSSQERRLVGSIGLEPMTKTLWASCSNQLSYDPVFLMLWFFLNYRELLTKGAGKLGGERFFATGFLVSEYLKVVYLNETAKPPNPP